ncbi:MAG: phosphonate ABC transporter ATP-binding protein [Syntrophobacteraceae bacterium]|nr:phosphonate ABC transporter ATP-binding protein [Syntrophobacteraceae bacterium]
MPPAISVTGLSKTFNGKWALNDINLNIAQGEFVALIGASGSGKSTLLRHISGFLAADQDCPSLITVLGRPVQRQGRIDREVRAVRAGIGFVFQQFNLAGRLPLITNVLTGLLHRVPWWRSLPGWFTQREMAEGFSALARVGIADCAWQRTSTLSGGQQQRAAIARSLVQRVKIILADEPIASLDPESARNVMEIISGINREQGVTVLVSLHQVEVALRYCLRTVALHHGRVVYDGLSRDLSPSLLRGLYGAAADEILDSNAAFVSAPVKPGLVPKVAEALG